MGIFFEEIEKLCGRGDTPFHMPGHKRKMLKESGTSSAEAFFSEWYKRDLTEINGSDDLHAPEGIIKEAEERAAGLFNAEHAYFLVNGSSAGILALLSAYLDPGDCFIMARGSHVSAYNAVMLRRLEPVYVCGDTDEESLAEICPGREIIKKALKEHPDAKAVFIVSPTYEGFYADIRGIAEAAHEKNIPLLVDAAHGAHFGFSKHFPENVISEGADAAVISLHKTLPAPTQTALLLTSGVFDRRERLRYFLSVYQSSSPSYLLMAGIDECVSLTERFGTDAFESFAKRVRGLTESLKSLENIKLKGAYSEGDNRPEPGKLMLIPKDHSSGAELSAYLEKKGITAEFALPPYVLLIISVCDDDKDLKRLREALLDADKQAAFWLKGMKKNNGSNAAVRYIPGKMMPLWKAAESKSEETDIKSAEGRICAECVLVYPPGRPLFVPGEVFDTEGLELLKTAEEKGLKIKGRLMAVKK